MEKARQQIEKEPQKNREPKTQAGFEKRWRILQDLGRVCNCFGLLFGSAPALVSARALSVGDGGYPSFDHRLFHSRPDQARAGSFAAHTHLIARLRGASPMPVSRQDSLT